MDEISDFHRFCDFSDLVKIAIFCYFSDFSDFMCEFSNFHRFCDLYDLVNLAIFIFRTFGDFNENENKTFLVKV